MAFFANITNLSEKAKHKIISRGDDIVLLAETHCTAEQNKAFMKLLNLHGWNATASAASATERSAKGNSAGVLAAIAKHVSNRPLSICSDVEGSTTSNPQLTGKPLLATH